jgi:gliding-associated putative ABC transporter substrate-binding component GldG
MDTVGNKDVHKTILLQTSEYSRAVNSPAILGFSRSIQQWGEPGYFNKSHLPIAVLLEGKFKSFFSNYQMDAALDLRKESEPSRMIVCADADLITNAVNPRTGETFPLGFDAGTYQRTHTLFGNKKFLLNCVDYLLDGSGLIEVRSKELAIRMLDPTKVKLQKGKWQLINMVFPVLMLLLFKALNDWIRNKKYGSI